MSLLVELRVWGLNFRKIMKETSDEAVGEPPSGFAVGDKIEIVNEPLSIKMAAVGGQDVLGSVGRWGLK